MTRLLGRLLLALAVLGAVLYLGDWAVWHARLVAGSGLGTVEVTDVVVAPLKGNKEEYYPDGVSTVTCSESIFPWSGAGACWWVQRHRTLEER